MICTNWVNHFSGELLFLIASRFLCHRKRRARVCVHWGSFLPIERCFCFSERLYQKVPYSSLSVSWKQNSLFPLWPVIKCLLMPVLFPTTYQQQYGNYLYWLGETICMEDVNYIGTWLIWPGSQIWPTLQRKIRAAAKTTLDDSRRQLFSFRV